MAKEIVDRRHMQAQLTQWDEKLAAWSVLAQGTTTAARRNYENDLASLRSKRERAYSLLLSLHTRGGNRWENVHDVVEHIWREIDEAFEEAAGRFR